MNGEALTGAHVFEWSGSRIEVAILPLPNGKTEVGGEWLVAWLNAPGGGRSAAVSSFTSPEWLASKWGGKGINRAEVAEVARVIVARLWGNA